MNLYGGLAWKSQKSVFHHGPAQNTWENGTDCLTRAEVVANHQLAGVFGKMRDKSRLGSARDAYDSDDNVIGPNYGNHIGFICQTSRRAIAVRVPMSTNLSSPPTGVPVF